MEVILPDEPVPLAVQLPTARSMTYDHRQMEYRVTMQTGGTWAFTKLDLKSPDEEMRKIIQDQSPGIPSPEFVDALFRRKLLHYTVEP